MTTYRELQESLNEKYELYTDDSNATWAEKDLITFGQKQGYKVKSILSTKEMGPKDMVVFELNDYDKKEVSNVKLKSGEQVYRYLTQTVKKGGMMPYIKINFDKGLVYYMTSESMSDQAESVAFETKGSKIKYARVLKGI